MRFKVIACKIFLREFYHIADKSDNIIDIQWAQQQLHNEPDKLRSTVQNLIDLTDAEDESYDAILLGYGLCSNGIVGISSKKYKIVVPRAHDCITLLLGSKERYTEIFNSRHGIYWYSPGWIEQSLQPGKERYEITYKQYLEKFGEENADYLMEMEQGWMKEYENAIYVGFPCMKCDKYIEYTKECAQYLSWNFEQITGDSGLIERMFDGIWNDDEFLIVQPNQKIEPSFNDNIIKAV